MTVGAVLASIKEFEDAKEKLYDCAKVISKISAEEKNSLEVSTE